MSTENMKQTIGIIGGSGFVGRALKKLVPADSYTVRIISRQGQSLPATDYRSYQPEKPATLAHALEHCQVAINLVGLLNQRLFHPHDFIDAHVRLVENIVQACHQQNIRRYIHVSALNVAADAPSQYLRSKHQGECVVRASGLQTTIFRPSVIFGAEDSFINRFAGLLKLSPGLFPLACAQARLAPVYVDDVAQLIIKAIGDPSSIGQTMHLCGPRTYSLKELVEYTARLLGRSVRVVALPDALARMQASIVGIMPGRPFTIDNYLSLQVDSVCPEKTELCRSRLEDIAPGYIHGRR